MLCEIIKSNLIISHKPIIGPPGDVGKVWNLVRGFFLGRDNWSVHPVFSYDPVRRKYIYERSGTLHDVQMCRCVCVCACFEEYRRI